MTLAMQHFSCANPGSNSEIHPSLRKRTLFQSGGTLSSEPLRTIIKLGFDMYRVIFDEGELQSFLLSFYLFIYLFYFLY